MSRFLLIENDKIVFTGHVHTHCADGGAIYIGDWFLEYVGEDSTKSTIVEMFHRKDVKVTIEIDRSR